MLEVTNLTAQRGTLTLFEEVGFRVAAGEALILTGANGTGKTTLLRMLSGLSHPARGQILWNGKPVSPFDGILRANALFTGHAPMIKDELTAAENLKLLVALAAIRVTDSAITEALSRVSLEKRHHVPARFLSQGQRRRIGLARLMLSSHILWVLDEPTTALDHAGIEMLTGIMRAHCEKGGAVIAATHQTLALANARSLAFA